MKKPGIIESLKLIKQNEWKDFEKFVASPYFNKGRNYMSLLKILKKFHPSFDSEDLTKEYIYSKLYGGKKFNDSVLKVMLSGLNTLCEDFIAQQNIRNDNSVTRISLIKELILRSDYIKANRKIEEHEKSISDKKIKYWDYDERLSLLREKTKLYYKYAKENKTIPLLNDVLKLSVYRFLYEIFEFESNQIKMTPYDRKKIFNESYENKLISFIDTKKILKEIGDKDKENFIQIYVLYLCYKINADLEDDISYFELKNVIEENIGLFGDETISKIYGELYSISMFKKGIGKTEFTEEIYNNLLKVLDGKYLKSCNEDGILPIVVFRNTILDFINSNLNRVKHFIETYFDCFHTDFQESLLNYGKAWVSYKEKKYDEALAYAGKVELESIVYKLDVKFLTSMIYFETNSFDSLFSLLDAYDHLLKNHFIQDKERFKRHKLYVKYLHELTKLKVDLPDKYKLHILREKISNENLTNKKWLLEKISEISSNN